MFYEDRQSGVSPSLCFALDSPSPVAVCLAAIALHHRPQRLPLVVHWATELGRAARPPPPVATALLALRLHGDRLTVLIHKVHFLPVMVARMLSRFGLVGRETRHV